MKKKGGWIFILFVAITISGCGQNRHELNRLGIASSLSIDYQAGESYLVGIQIINPDAVHSQKGRGEPVVTYQGEGDTLVKAMLQAEQRMPRHLFLQSLRFLIMNEEAARKQLSTILDFLRRERRIRSDFLMTVTKEEKAVNLLLTSTEIEEIPGEYLYQNMVRYARNKSIYKDKTLYSVIRDMEVKDIFLPGVRVRDTEGKKREKRRASFVAEDFAIFSGGNFVGWTTPMQSETILHVLGETSNWSVPVRIPGCKEDVDVIVKDSKVRLSSKITNNVPSIQLTIDVDVSMGVARCREQGTRKSMGYRVEKAVQERVQSSVQKGIRSILSSYHADIFGFGWLIQREHPREWKNLANNWRETLDRLDVVVQIHANIVDMPPWKRVEK